MENVTWYYKESGESKGPVPEADLTALFSGGRLPAETPVSKDCGEWAEARTVVAFTDALAVAAASVVRPPVEPLGKLEKETAPAADRPQARPWVRFWARCIDLLLLSALVMPLFLGLVGGYGLFQMLLWVGFCLLVEAAMVTALAATPGKLLLGISVRTTEGRRLSFGQSLLRAGRVLLLGMGLGVPVVNLVTMFLSYRRLLAEGWTLWDTYGPFSVTHKAVGVGRSSFGALVTAACLAFLLVVRPSPGSLGLKTGPSAAAAQAEYAPKGATRPASQPASAGTVMIRPVTEPTTRKAHEAVVTKPGLTLKPTTKPTFKSAPKSATKPAARPTVKQSGQGAKPQGGGTKEAKSPRPQPRQ